jgi:hypothetical protein
LTDDGGAVAGDGSPDLSPEPEARSSECPADRGVQGDGAVVAV